MSPVQRFHPFEAKQLSIFLTVEGGRPLGRVPVYAEIALPAPVPEWSVSERFEEMLRSALFDLDEQCGHDTACRQSFTDALRRALARTFDEMMLDHLLAEADGTRELFTEVIERLRTEARAASLMELDLSSSDRRVEIALRAAAARRDLAVEPATSHEPVSAYPLGMLGSDHTGYLSYDLSCLPLSVREQVADAAQARLRGESDLAVALLVYPFGLVPLRFDALAQGRIGAEAVVARQEIEIPEMALARTGDGAPAMQNPSLTDWRLSPASFVANPTALLGQDGCEQLFPAQLALQEYFFYQVVGLNDVALPAPRDDTKKVRAGFVQEYRTAWYALGHSLGRILYSLPLAPGESVNLAVIDWRRQDKSQREEQTTVAEELTHRQTRDRTITETVTAAIDEWQRGGNIMGGAAGSFGAGAWSASAALGGGYSTSSGSRDLAANTVQKLSDNIAQASSSYRELNSTVVLETTQTEKEAIETRTIVNYNHAHTLTVLYYEVLRHFRVLTEFVRRRPAVLIKAKTDWFTEYAAAVDENILEHRAAIEAALLDPKYAAGLDALARIAHRSRLALVVAPPVGGAVPPAALGPGDRKFIFFISSVRFSFYNAAVIA